MTESRTTPVDAPPPPEAPPPEVGVIWTVRPRVCDNSLDMAVYRLLFEDAMTVRRDGELASVGDTKERMGEGNDNAEGNE